MKQVQCIIFHQEVIFLNFTDISHIMFALLVKQIQFALEIFKFSVNALLCHTKNSGKQG